MNIKTKTLGLIGMTTLISIGTLSCSDDDTDMENHTPEGTISFGAVVPKASREASTTTTSINNFTVYAFTGNKLYMDGVKVSRNGSKWSYSPVVYWPATSVDFYAYSPDISNVPSVETSALGKITDYNNNGSTDLLYAVNMNETAKASPVLMNFRHAMSRVDILLSSQNQDLKVKVGHVVLKNVYMRGSFTFPQATTSPMAPENIGTWSDLKHNIDILTYYSVDYEDFTTLTSTPTNLTDNNLNISFMVPQPLAELTFDGTQYTGTAIQVDCEIFDSKTGAKIWPNDATPSYQLVPETSCGKLMFPTTTESIKNWKQGHAYVYNISIDNPTVLHPIDFDVSVDEFTLDSTE